MKEKTLSQAIHRIALAYVFILLDINLNSFNILPEWIGFALIYAQLDTVAKSEESAKLLKPLAAGLAAWDLLCWVVSEPLALLGDFPGLIAAAVSLYFHFQLLTNLASIADSRNAALGNKLRGLRTGHTLLITAFSLPWVDFSTENFSVILVILVAELAILGWTVKTLSDLAESVE